MCKSKLLKVKTLFWALVLTHQMGFAQHPGFCLSSDDLYAHNVDGPRLMALQKSLDEAWAKSQESGTQSLRAAPIYVLPVVFHIVHDNGVGDLTDTEVQRSLGWLNDAFANRGYFDQGTGVDVQLEFCLAQRDPQNGLTSGINRVNSSLTNFNKDLEDKQVKDLIRWNPTSYINIWIVNEITSLSSGSGVAGYAYFPGAHGSDVDGIVVESRFTGQSEMKNAVLIHEMGHYLGLYHTFESGCANADCLRNGDQVCDTPPDQSTAYVPCKEGMNSCNTDVQSGFSQDEDDLIINYMDYSDLECYSMFTGNQKERMMFFVEGARRSLLKSLGCESPCTRPIVIDISLPKDTIVICDSVSVTNNTINGDLFVWLLDGVEYSMDRDIKVYVTEKGVHELILQVESADGLCRSQDTLYFVAHCPVVSQILNPIYHCIPTADTVLTFEAYDDLDYTFDWYLNDVYQGSLPTYTGPFGIGTYRIKLVTKNGKCADSTFFILRIGCQEICGNGFDDDGDGLYDCYDPDCCSDCGGFYYQACTPADCNEDVNAFSIREKWRYDTKTGNISLASMYAGDMNGDGRGNLVVPLDLAPGYAVLDGDGNVQDIIYNDPLYFPNRAISIGIADTDRDGRGEVFYVGADHRIICVEAGRVTRFVSEPAVSDNLLSFLDFPSVNIADLNVDGVPEVVFALNIFNSLTGELLYSPPSNFDPGYPVGRYVLADILPDEFCADCKGLEIVGASQIFSISEDNTRMTAEVTLTVPSDARGQSATVDWDLDGDLDVLSTFNLQGFRRLMVWEGQSNSVLGSLGISRSLSAPVICNVDQDPFPEVIILANLNGTNDLVQCLDNNLAYLWLYPFKDASSISPVAFDFDGDNVHEILLRGQQEMHIINGTDGTNIYRDSCFSITNDERPVIADLDGDGHAELAISCSNEVVVYEGDETEWSYTRPVFNQYLINHMTINDDLTIPSFGQQCHLPNPNRNLNSSMTQYSRPYRVGISEYSLMFDSLICTGGQLRLHFAMCEFNGLDVDSISLTWYDGDPDNPSTRRVQKNKIKWMRKGSDPCYTSSLDLSPALSKHDRICLILNDNGTQRLPFDLDTIKSLSPIKECSLIENMICFDLMIRDTPLENIPDTSICDGQVLHFELGEKWEKVLWSTGSTLDHIDVRMSGTYWVEVVNECGFIHRDSFFVEQLDPGHLDLPEKITLCEFGVEVIHAGGGFVSYRWSDLSEDSTFTVFGPGKYWVDVVDHCGNILSDTVVVVLNASDLVSLADTIFMCSGDSIEVAIGSYPTIVWTPNSDVRCQDCNEQILYPSTSRYYYVYVVDENGCGDSDSVFVQVGNASVQRDTFTICQGDSLFYRNEFFRSGDHQITIDAKGDCDSIVFLHVLEGNAVYPMVEVHFSCPSESNGSARFDNLSSNGYTLLWYSQWINQDTLLEGLGPQRYDYSIMDSSGCVYDFSLTIEEFVPTSYTIDLTHSGCDSSLVWTLTASGGGISEAVLVSNMGVEHRGKQFTIEDEGQYSFAIWDTNGCTIIDTTLVFDISESSFFSLPDTIFIQKGDTAFAVISGDLTAIQQIDWMLGEANLCPHCGYLLANPSVSNEYSVLLVDSSGCEYIINTYVKVLFDPEIYVPNVFSPNGDDINDLFKPYTSSEEATVVNFEIYSRWGELIYRESDVDLDMLSGWDGTFNRRPLSNGVFVYRIALELEDQNTIMLTGTVTLAK